MLERFSKDKQHMFVKKRVRVNKKASEDQQMNENPSDDDEDIQERVRMVDREFHFDKFQSVSISNLYQRFVDESILKTFLIYLRGYRQFDPESDQLKRIVTLLHRQAIKAKGDAIFFKVSILIFFKEILNEKREYEGDRAFQDLVKLIQYILKKFFALTKEKPNLLFEIFWPKRKSEWKKIIAGDPDSDADEYDDDGNIVQKQIRLPAEMEFKRDTGLSLSQQIGVAVGCILDDQNSQALDWVLDVSRSYLL